jgi:beta-lactam-binding protein with PASTA domain
MKVTLYTSAGPDGFTMPDLVTTPTLEADAVTTLNGLGVTDITVTCSRTNDSTDPRIGQVIGQFPSAGTFQGTSEYVRITIRRTSCL